jgi:hypothetical protein
VLCSAASSRHNHVVPLQQQAISRRPLYSSRNRYKRSIESIIPAATADDDDAASAQPDIDQLAAFLTQKAAQMRASMDEQDLLPTESRADVAADTDDSSNKKPSDSLMSLDSLLGLDSVADMAMADAAMASADAAVPAGAAVSAVVVWRGGGAGGAEEADSAQVGTAVADVQSCLLWQRNQGTGLAVASGLLNLSRRQLTNSRAEFMYASCSSAQYSLSPHLFPGWRTHCLLVLLPAFVILPQMQGPLNTLDAVNEFEDDRGFIPQDFAIVKLLGKLGVQVRKRSSCLSCLNGVARVEWPTSASSIMQLPAATPCGVTTVRQLYVCCNRHLVNCSSRL